MKLTTNYSLKKPEGSDVVNIEDLNYNANVIDNALLQNKNDILNVNEGIRSELDEVKDKVSNLINTTTTINYRNLRNDITFLNGWGIWGNENRFNCYVADNVVKICILLSPSVLTPWTPIFKLPAQYTAQRKEFITCIDNNMRCYMGSLNESGTFTFENAISSESAYVAINFTYPLIKKVI